MTEEMLRTWNAWVETEDKGAVLAESVRLLAAEDGALPADPECELMVLLVRLDAEAEAGALQDEYMAWRRRRRLEPRRGDAARLAGWEEDACAWGELFAPWAPEL